MRILAAHNYYRLAGGEDRVYESEADLLENRGHTVHRYIEHNRDIASPGLTAVRGMWNRSSYTKIRDAVATRTIEVAHFHNTFPLISPSGYYAVRRGGGAVVQTIHNYRLLCPGATLWRRGAVCEECIDHQSFLPAMVHRCYRQSSSATAAVTMMLATHHRLGTYRHWVDAYVAPSEFVRSKLVAGGLGQDTIVIKPNFLSEPIPSIGQGGGGALFVGRDAPEKGVSTLIEAWNRIADVKLKIAGAEGNSSGSVTYLGRQPKQRVLALMQDATVLIFPSTWYECAPLTIVEALACGTPVIASNLGSMPEFVRHGHNGLLFTPGDAEDLARQVRWAFDHPDHIRVMRANARREFEEKYTADRNYKMLIAIYEQAIENAKRRRAAN